MNKKSITDFISDPQVLKIINDNLENIVKYSGIHHNDTYEIKTNFNKADCETVISSRNNSYIVLGRDRDGGIASGKGGTGGTGCGSIDLIAGLAGPTPIDTVFGQEILTDKSFKNDAARIYISQRSSVDFQFEIPIFLTKLGAGGVNLDNSDDKSAVALKADCVRVIARENIKLVTFHKGLNSQNKKSSDGGIDIIAGCNAVMADKNLDLQPMVKGNNLLQLLKEMRDIIIDVQSTVATFMKKQKQINDTMQNHIHQSGAAGYPTTPPVDAIALQNYQLLQITLPDILKNYINQKTLDGNYFSPTSERFINSLWNRVN